jgi:hypothetical protein
MQFSTKPGCGVWGTRAEEIGEVSGMVFPESVPGIQSRGPSRVAGAPAGRRWPKVE